ncbi:MATE family efflux transporter [Ruminococcus sp. AF18-22]|nr:MATE family efflux transporter [Ruminococcus sp. AF18-22]
MAAVNMTNGTPVKQLFFYAVPLILGNFFQLAYNAADAVIAGRFIGKEALAATGTASPVMNILILGISGLCIGAGVIMSSYFGAGRIRELKDELATALLFGCISTVVIAFAGSVFIFPLLKVLRVPDTLLSSTALYLRIIFLGAPFTYFYNTLSAALKSIGDAKTPLKFLLFSSLLNIVLDLLFIGLLGYGITCSAVTTVAAQILSALLCAQYIYRKIPLLQLKFSDLRLHKSLLKTTLRYGSVTALQQACQPIGKLLIQGCVNTLGIDVIAAYNAVTRIDDFAFTPQQSIAQGITTFTAQNQGAKKPERIICGFYSGLKLEFFYWILICICTLLLHEPVLRLFTENTQTQMIVHLGSRYLSVMAFFYLLPAFTNGIQGFFRGIGNMRITLISTFIQTSLRVIFTFLLLPRFGIQGIPFACAVGWTFMLLYEVPRYLSAKKQILSLNLNK